MHVYSLDVELTGAPLIIDISHLYHLIHIRSIPHKDHLKISSNLTGSKGFSEVLTHNAHWWIRIRSLVWVVWWSWWLPFVIVPVLVRPFPTCIMWQCSSHKMVMVSWSCSFILSLRKMEFGSNLLKISIQIISHDTALRFFSNLYSPKYNIAVYCQPYRDSIWIILLAFKLLILYHLIIVNLHFWVF